MGSQLEYLKKALVESEARSGPDNPFVQGLKAQIAMHEKPRADNPMDNSERFSLGSRGAPSSKGLQHQQTLDELDRILAEEVPQQFGKTDA